ncbi:MAG: hypothetical protein L3J23_05670 [Flavobacteriaceae bacterium]|nr:hypothetical protein [Flavobacteriaceae bacterium]
MGIKKITILFLLLQISLFGQIKKSELNGKWKTSNDNDLFQLSDTINFYKNEFFVSIKSCNQIIWEIKNRKLKTKKVHNCSEPGRVIQFNEKEKIKIKKTDFGQVLEIYLAKNLIDKFRIISNNKQRKVKRKRNIKQLNLMRFDKLTDEKLYKYVDSLIFKVLKYKVDTSKNENFGTQISTSNPNVKIRIRDGYIGNPEPLIVVNGYPIKNKSILKNLLLVETYNIVYLTKEKSAYLYGTRAINGVIIMNTSEKRFKIVRKNTAGNNQ